MLITRDDLVLPHLQGQAVDAYGVDLEQYVRGGLESGCRGDSSEAVALVMQVVADKLGRPEIELLRTGCRSGHGDRHEHSGGAVAHLVVLHERGSDSYPIDGQFAIVDRDWFPGNASDNLEGVFGVAQPESNCRHRNKRDGSQHSPEFGAAKPHEPTSAFTVTGILDSGWATGLRRAVNGCAKISRQRRNATARRHSRIGSTTAS